MPPLPWTRGRHGTHEVASIEVQVCRDEFGRVFSCHNPVDKSDQELMADWPGHGLEQVALALLTEALRREALLQMIIRMSQDKDFVAKLNAMSPEDRQKELDGMRARLTTQVRRTTDRLAKDVVNEAFNLVNQ